MLENIKQCKDAQDPDDEASNKVRTEQELIPCCVESCNEIHKKYMYMLLTLQKLYAVCDIALGLLVSKATNITLKDSNVEPVLPSKCFVKQAKVCTSDSPDFS